VKVKYNQREADGHAEQIGVRDVERAQNKRDRRSVCHLLDTRNTTHPNSSTPMPIKIKKKPEETYLNESTHEFNYSYPTSNPYLISSAYISTCQLDRFNFVY
jgi:hypothetical protein